MTGTSDLRALIAEVIRTKTWVEYTAADGHSSIGQADPEEIADAVLAAVLPAHRRQVLAEAADDLERVLADAMRTGRENAGLDAYAGASQIAEWLRRLASAAPQVVAKAGQRDDTATPVAQLGYVPAAEVDDLRQRLKATSDECNAKANALHRVRALADRAAGYGFVLAPEQVYEALDGEDEPQAGVPDRPRTWALPDEPGPEVTAVRDHNGDVWKREEDRDGHSWQRRAPSGVPAIGWPYLVRHYGPLTDATPADGQDAP